MSLARCTVVFSDLQGSTALGERLDPETLRSVLRYYFDEMAAAFAAHGGTIEKIIGDAIVALFVGDDHALRATAAVVQAGQSLLTLNGVLKDRWGVELVNRTGLGTGDLAIADAPAGRVLSGPAIDAAMLLEAAAPPEGALLSEGTVTEVGNLVVTTSHPSVADGKGGTLIAHRLVHAEPLETSTVGCARCGATHAPEKRCSPRPDTATETRRAVTVVFADPRPRWSGEESPALVGEVMARYFAAVHAELDRHGGTVERFIGDAVMAVFGLPHRHEDDALRAVRSAAALRDAVAALNTELADRGVVFDTRIGVNTGTVVAGDAKPGQRLVTGDAVNVAARLEQSAGVGEILIGDLTRRLSEGLIEYEAVTPLHLKGKSEAVAAYRFVRLADRRHRPSATEALVGRSAELERLRGLLTSAIDSAKSHRVTLVGEAGVGKSHLIADFVTAAESDARILHGHCLEYGEGITLWPVAELVRNAAGIADQDTPETAAHKVQGLVSDKDVARRLISLSGLTETQYPMAELAWSIRRFVEEAANHEPVVILIDDAQWAAGGLIDLLLEALQPIVQPVVAICVGRTAFLDGHPEWADDPDALIQLDALGPAEVRLVISGLLGGADVGKHLAAQVTDAADGNPLFVEQLVRMLLETGELEQTAAGWELGAGSTELQLPPTLDALLGARLDTLETPERVVVDTASVIGRRFPTPALERMLGARLAPDGLNPALDALVARALFETLALSEDGDAISGFRHLLVRDAAYSGLLKAERATLHERFVEWADEVNRRRGREIEFEEILGYHLEQAHVLLTELGPLTAHGIALGIEASQRLAAAGDRALVRGDMVAATNLMTRSAAALADDHPRRPRLLLQSGECLLERAQFEEAAIAIDAAIDSAAAIGDLGIQLAARVEKLRLQYDTSAEFDSTTIAAELDEIRPILEEHGDPEGLARLWRLAATVALVGERWTDAEAAARQMVRYAQQSGDVAMELRVLPALAGIARYGPLPVEEAIDLCRALLERTGDNKRAETSTLLPMARLLAMKGDFDQARSIHSKARDVLDELGWTLDAALVSLDSGPIEMLAGNPDLAETELRRDYDALVAMGDDYYVATTAALLAEAVYRQGRLDEAAELAAFTEATAEEDDVAPQFLWRAVAAKVAARRSDAETAARLIEEAVHLTEDSEDPSGRGDVLTDLAEVRWLAGDAAGAAEALARAVACHAAKGNKVAQSRTEGLLRSPEHMTKIGEPSR